MSKKDKVYNVRIVEDETNKPMGIIGILFVLIMTLGIYLLFNGKELWIAFFEEGNFMEVLSETGKELIYSTGLTFVALIVNSIAYLFKKK